MRQIVPKVCTNLGYNTSTLFQYSGLVSGNGVLTDSSPFSTTSLMVLPGTVLRMTLYDGVGIPLDTTVTIHKGSTMGGGAPTVLTLTMPAGAAGRMLTTNPALTVDWDEGDFLYYQFHNSALLPPFGVSISVCVELEVAAYVYSLGAASYNPSISTGLIGGVFGNGNLDQWAGIPTGPLGMGPTYSPAGIDGQVIRLGLKRNGVPAGGQWDAILIKNGVVQDGSGGTPNTNVTLPDASGSDYLAQTIALPFVRPNAVSAATVHNITGPGATTISIGVAVLPTTPGEFMLSGGEGSNGSGADAYNWVEAFASNPSLGAGSAAAGQTDFEITGLYMERGGPGGFNAPGVGSAFIYTIYVNGIATSITCTQADLAVNASVQGPVVTVQAGDTVTIQIHNINPTGAAGANMHWGVAARFPGPPPPELPCTMPMPPDSGGGVAEP